MLKFVVVSLLVLIGAVQGTLYGYKTDSDGTNGQLVAIDPSTGNYKPLPCDLSKLPQPLSGAPANTDLASGLLQFFYVDDTSQIFIIQMDPTNCKSTNTKITGLNNGQDAVRDMKYGGTAGSLYMVFPDPNCMHGSLDIINGANAKVQKTITTVVDPDGFSHITALSAKQSKYYYVGLPFPPVSLNYLLNIVDLSSGDFANITLQNNSLGLGDMWDTNYTMSAYDSANGVVLFGAVTPPSNLNAKTTANPTCSPSGFFTVDAKNGNVRCANGPLNLNVYPLAEFDGSTNFYYQIFTDSKFSQFYLVTYDVVNNKIVSQVNCDVCAQLVTLSVL